MAVGGRGWKSIRNCYGDVEFAAKDPVWRFPDQGTFTGEEVVEIINNNLGQNGGQPDEIVVPKPGDPFVEYEDEWEEQKEDEDDGYYEALGHKFGVACVSFELFTLRHIVLKK